MTTQSSSAMGATEIRTPATTKQVLFATRDEEQLGDVGQALRELSCKSRVVTSVSDALKLNLEQYLAIVLDESVTSGLAEDLAQLVLRAPPAALIVACDTSSRYAITTTLATSAAEWIAKPIDNEEFLGRIHRFERQRRTRAELEDSLHFIQRVADATPEMLYLFDAQDGYTIYVNQQVCSVLGCTPEGIPAEGFMFFHSVAHPDDVERAAGQLASKLATARDIDVIQSEYRILDQHRRWRCLQTRETVFHRDEDGHPKQILGAAHDVTDRKELEQTQALLAAIVASSDDAIIGKTLDGEIISWNEAAASMYGYTKDEVIGQNISLLVPADRQNEVPALLERIRLGERRDHYKTTRCHKDGTTFKVSITISPIKNRNGQVTGASTIARRL